MICADWASGLLADMWFFFDNSSRLKLGGVEDKYPLSLSRCSMYLAQHLW